MRDGLIQMYTRLYTRPNRVPKPKYVQLYSLFSLDCFDLRAPLRSPYAETADETRAVEYEIGDT